jgi:hypothetical protein
MITIACSWIARLIVIKMSVENTSMDVVNNPNQYSRKTFHRYRRVDFKSTWESQGSGIARYYEKDEGSWKALITQV